MGLEGDIDTPTQLPLSVVSSSAQIDLNREFGARPETDITAKINEAIGQAVTAGARVIDIRLSTVGLYLLEGALKEGEAFGHKYAGQILLPARETSEGRIIVRIAGLMPAPKPQLGSGAEPVASTPGVTLRTNLVTGKVFDVVPSHAGPAGAGGPFSDILAIFENFTLQAPPNPQCWGIDVRAATRARVSGVAIEPDRTDVGVEELPTGTGIGLALPWLENAGSISVRDSSIAGWATGLGLSEHADLTDVFLGENNVALEGYGAGHVNTFRNVLLEENAVGLRARSKAESEAAKIVAEGQGGMLVSGVIEFENVLTNYLAPVALTQDPESRITGFLVEDGNSRHGKPIVGSLNLDVAAIPNAGTSWRSCYPIDDWKRNPLVAGNLGTCGVTRHPWRILEGKFNAEGAEGGAVKQGEVAVCRAVVPYFRRTGNGSREIITAVAVGASGTSNIALILNDVVAGAKVGHYLKLRWREGKMVLFLEPGATNLAEAAVAAAKTYEVRVIITCNTFGVPTKIEVFLGTKKELEYALTEANQAELVDSQALEAQDGIYINKDAESSFTTNAQGVGFQVQPA